MLTDKSGLPRFDLALTIAGIDISYLLQSRDLKNNSKPILILDSTRLLEIAEKAINYGDDIPTLNRPYVSNPLRFIYTVTNLRGVPFELSLFGSLYKHTMVMLV